MGLERRPAAEAGGRQALARWEATLAAGEVSEGLRKEEREAVTKLEVLLKVGPRLKYICIYIATRMPGFPGFFWEGVGSVYGMQLSTNSRARTAATRCLVLRGGMANRTKCC